MTIGETIKSVRERRGLKQSDCAKAIGVAQSTWCDWERGQMRPRPNRLKQIAGLLGIQPSKLISKAIAGLLG